MTDRAAVDSAALAWAAALAEEGIQLVGDDGQPLPTAALALAFEMAREAEVAQSCKKCRCMTPMS